jgi:hypothetical protein
MGTIFGPTPFWFSFQEFFVTEELIHARES